MIKKLLIAVSIAVMALTASNVFAITVGDPGFELGSYWSYNSGTNASSDRTNTFPPDGYASYTSAIADTYSAFMNVEQASGFAQVYQQFTTGFSEGDMVGLSGRVVQFDGEADQRWGQIKIEFYNGVDPISDFVSTEGF